MHGTGLIDPDLSVGLLDARDASVLAERLLTIANSHCGVDEVFAYRVDDRGAPKVIASSSGLADAGERIAAYSRRFHRSDPLVAVRSTARPGTGFVARFSPEMIELGDYRRLCFDHPRFGEKICFGWRRPDHALVVSFYRRSRSEPDMAQLGMLAQLAVTGLTRIAQTPRPVVDEIAHRLAQAYPGLTAREVQVCSRTLAGETARMIGEQLQLSVGTVLTYRQRAYQRLGMNKANDLLASVMG